jgi:hypothetical protein
VIRLAPRALLGLAAAAVSVTVLACTEDPLPLGAGSAPGSTTETIDVTLDVSSVAGWRDTTVSGFATRSSASFSYVSNDAVLSARTLALFDVPDTIRTFADTLPAAEYDSVSFRLQLDTARSEFTDFPVTLRLVALDRPFDADEASWTEASAGVPWTSPGGDLGVQLASGVLESKLDTLPMALEVSADSLLKAWRAADGGNGLAIVAEGGSARILVRQILLRYEAMLVGRTEVLNQTQTPDGRTFITDPPAPPTGLPLRLGGLPASRLYVDFRLPTSIGGVPVTGATVNHAEVVLTPLGAPMDPYALDRALAARQISLLGDPFVLGNKTPIGSANLTTVGLSPDSLAVGKELRLDITPLVARSVQDPDRVIRIGLRADPDAQALGFWEFGSAESAAAFRPKVRIILSPPADFPVP